MMGQFGNQKWIYQNLKNTESSQLSVVYKPSRVANA